MRGICINRNLYRWFEEYLTNRKQIVVLNGERSSWQLIKAGVPQGSVVEPILFLIYINDIGHNLTAKPSLFADDTSLSKHAYC